MATPVTFFAVSGVDMTLFVFYSLWKAQGWVRGRSREGEWILNSDDASSVLIVEDDPSLRKLLRVILRHAGIAADEAINGREASELLGRKRYDLVLLDLMLPVVSGYDVLDEIGRTDCVGCVILITAASDVDLEQVDYKLVRSVVRKPFDVHALRDTVLDALEETGFSRTAAFVC
jgi:DNA-binding response OmpR family regulator